MELLSSFLVMIKNLIFCCLWISSLMWLNACQTSKVPSSDQPTQDIFDKEYYLHNAKNNTERLKMLLSGVFTLHGEDIEKDTHYTWLIGDGEEKDSMLLYAIPVGQPSKDGHWLYCHQFITHSPDKPVYAAFQSFRQKSRDTIESTFFKLDTEISLDDLLTKGAANFENVNFKELEENGERVIFVKSGQATFVGESKVYPNPLLNKDNFRKDKYNVSPTSFDFHMVYFKDKNGQESDGKNLIINHMIRLAPSDSPFFKKNKKSQKK